MNADIIRKLDMLETADRCVSENPIHPPLARATAARSELTTAITILRAAAQNQLTGGNRSTASVTARKLIARRLIKAMQQIGGAARSLEEEYPGISRKFRQPRSRTYTVLIAAASAMITAIADYQPAFSDTGITPAYLTGVTDLLAEFQKATAGKHNGGNTRVNSTATLRIKARQGVRAVRKLGACMQIHFRDNPAVLAEWAHASHIERAPKRKPATLPSEGRVSQFAPASTAPESAGTNSAGGPGILIVNSPESPTSLSQPSPFDCSPELPASPDAEEQGPPRPLGTGLRTPMPSSVVFQKGCVRCFPIG